MANLDTIVEDLKTLPPQALERAARYIHRLMELSQEDRLAALDRTAGSLTKEEADAWEQAINEDCERIDAGDW